MTTRFARFHPSFATCFFVLTFYFAFPFPLNGQPAGLPAQLRCRKVAGCACPFDFSFYLDTSSSPLEASLDVIWLRIVEDIFREVSDSSPLPRVQVAPLPIKARQTGYLSVWGSLFSLATPLKKTKILGLAIPDPPS